MVNVAGNLCLQGNMSNPFSQDTTCQITADSMLMHWVTTVFSGVVKRVLYISSSPLEEL